MDVDYNTYLDFKNRLKEIQEEYPICREFQIINIKYSKSGFKVQLSKESYDRIRKSDILIFNHKTKQYRTFVFETKDENGKHFKCGNIELNIYCTES